MNNTIISALDTIDIITKPHNYPPKQAPYDQHSYGLSFVSKMLGSFCITYTLTCWYIICGAQGLQNMTGLDSFMLVIKTHLTPPSGTRG